MLEFYAINQNSQLSGPKLTSNRDGDTLLWRASKSSTINFGLLENQDGNAQRYLFFDHYLHIAIFEYDGLLLKYISRPVK
jgi:hypothetical protein